MCVLFYSSFVCMSAYANVFSTIICKFIRQINIQMSGVIAGVLFDSAGRFWDTLLLRTTCMRLCCN